MLDRLWDRLKGKLPTKQSAYQPGRGTTEQVHSIKLLAEKAIISSDYTINLLLIDMSKAFDTVNRNILFEHLEDILHDDELYILHRLTNNPQIAVKIGNTTGKLFTTTTGIMQGDCLSAILFIYYLAMCLRRPIYTKTRGFLINPMYTDDLTLAGTNQQQIQDTKTVMTARLKEYDLKVNETKTEKYIIPRPPPPPPPPTTVEELLAHKQNRNNWSNLDWLLDTSYDIERRKGITLDSIQKFEYIYKSKRISTELKIRTFNTYTASIFLYNSELWAITDTLQDDIDSFHRRLLRRAIDIRWPKLISNNERLYEKVKVEKWSKIIRRRRLNWLGHLMRLDEQTPVRHSLQESLSDIQGKVGRPKLKWIKVIEKDLVSVNINLDLNRSTPDNTIRKLVELTNDRKDWRKIIRDIMAVNC